MPEVEPGPPERRTEGELTARSDERAGWTFLTNHAHVLLAVAAAPDSRVTDVARRVGISSRATVAILNDLEAAGYVHRTRRGRRTHYTVDQGRPFRHPTTAAHAVGELLAIFGAPRGEDGAAPAPSS
ncbi:MarR family transcriptional regulator [Georgenia muralis]|uniref:MarR family protein n=1 Tax=Georgenia muralis TaxID=154117 RepID=A0A3N4Z542_9MICO|nr:MarR family transcriptional regulator [Georgenia muralis]RPF26866.1 MarR family protein [Georgenia muralis]